MLITVDDYQRITGLMVSVLSPIGVALLGCREGDIASWRVPGGIGRFEVEKVLYQPEAEGHFSL